MAHDVFISYSTADKLIADAVCANLEQQGVRCWIAPRDVLPGEIWGSAIVEAIHKSPVMVVVFSSSSNKSPQVMREVERAVNKGLVVVPFRIEAITPSENMEYFLSSTHWLDAMTLPLEQHIASLASTVQVFLERRRSQDGPPEAPPPPEPAPSPALPAREVAKAAPHPELALPAREEAEVAQRVEEPAPPESPPQVEFPVSREAPREPEPEPTKAGRLAPAPEPERSIAVKTGPAPAAAVRAVVKLYRRLAFVVVAYLGVTVGVVSLSGKDTTMACAAGVTLLLSGLGLLFPLALTSYRLGLRLGMAHPVPWAFFMLIPGTNVLRFFAYASKAQEWFREQGVPAGWLGPSRRRIRELRPGASDDWGG